MTFRALRHHVESTERGRLFEAWELARAFARAADRWEQLGELVEELNEADAGEETTILRLEAWTQSGGVVS